nr:hypothetical protein [Tanacetum cinerariifolium]
MVINKSWTSLGKHEKAFYIGLKKFVDDCKPLVDSAGPCKSCRLVLWVSIKHLSGHISKYGFDPSYKTWIHHGEPDLPLPSPVIDNTRQPHMSDMIACLNDLSYIPLNNEQNEPTQGDIGETSNDLTQAKRNKFKELYASANEELYPGCDYVTRLDFMAKFTYFKVKGVETIDVATGQKFNMRAMVLWTINDFPARSRLSGWSGQGYRACPTCNEDTPYGYVAEEALTFSSHYFRDVTMKFNRPNRNMDCPPPTCQFQVFKSLCKSIGLWLVIRIDHQELKKVICEFPNKDMKEEFLGWFGKQIRQRHVDNDSGVSESSELIALACGPSQTPISVNSCIVNGVRFFGHSRDECRTTQNSGICSPGPDREMYYDIARRPLGWKVVEHVSHKKFLNGGVIVVEDERDVIDVDNSSDLALSTSLNDLEITALHIDGQSTDVDAPPDIVDAMSADVARGHNGDSSGDDRPPPYQIPTGCGGCLRNRGKGTRKPNLGGRRAGRLHTRQETRNL